MTPLRAALEAAASADEVCDFCDARPAADMDVLLELLVAGLKSEYGDEGTIAANDDSGAATRLVVDTSGDRSASPMCTCTPRTDCPAGT
jgi:hypothetical protein